MRSRKWPKVEERIASPCEPNQGDQQGHQRGATQEERVDGRVAADERDRQQAQRDAGSEQRPTHDVEPLVTFWPRPGSSRGPRVDGRQQREWRTQIEDPAPARRDQRAAGQVERLQDRGTDEWPGSHAQERQRAHDADCAGAGLTIEEVSGGGRGEREDGARAGALNDPRGNQGIQALGGAGGKAADGKGAQAEAVQRGEVETVGCAAGQRHDRDIGNQVAVDDPRGAAQLSPIGQVVDDLRQRHGGDHQLDAHEERAHPERREHQQPCPSRHSPSIAAHRPRRGGLDTSARPT